MRRKHLLPALQLPLLLSLLLPLLTGCHKDTVAGKWQGTAPGPGGSSVAMTYEFTPEGKEVVSAQASGGPVSFTVGGTGTYKVDGTNLTQTITTMTMGSMTYTLPPDKSQPQTAPFTLDGDHLTLTSPQTKQSVTLTRVKQ